MINANTTVHMPPMGSSDEANEHELNLARAQGDSFGRALDHMTQDVAHGKVQRAGDYLVGYAVEDAEGMYSLVDGELVWRNPQDENIHVEVVVRDGADGRFVPALDVTATLIDSEGNEIGTHQQPFLWHPWLYHYGRNWRVPGPGDYTLRIHIALPNFMRHDKINGQRYATALDVEFTEVTISPGQKKS
jgi:hypothetical protein